ncbi:ComEC/Rec2 family competence protein [Agreia sp. COWG]|uniref:ComEC/Rec2 family competence protein n=1 Tax=Agreia sp. COWG TaxID=2773266 RepID=UPI0019293684|nr:ComEC/Rec2 family competence protein [Agreia sp. COWG]CAD5996615.1 Lactamase_B domain-containing protein [Agreia sp. COWG]
MTHAADFRLLVPAIVGWAGAFVLVALPAQALAAAVISLGVVAALALGWVLLRRAGRGRRVRAALPTLTLCAALCACIAAGIAAAGPSREPVLLDGATGAHLTASLTITGTPSKASHAGFAGTPVEGIRMAATLDRLESGRGSEQSAAPVLVFIDGLESTEAPPIGSSVTVRGTFRATEPGSQTAWLLFADGHPVITQQPGWQLAWAAHLRAGFVTAAEGLPGDGGHLVPGLAIGDESLVTESLDTAMKNSGLSHLTAVSGANCAIVIAGVLLLGGFVRLRRTARLCLAGAVLAGFVVLVTPQPSVIRAAAMAAIVLVSVGASRSARGLPVLCLAVSLLILSDPWLSRSYGFALSALATAGLLLLTRPLTRVFARFLPAWAALGLAVPVAAQLACEPVLILLQPSVAPYSVVANVLAAPAAPIATVVGLVACLLGALSPPLGALGAWLCWLPAAWIAAVARFFSDAPGARIPWLPGVAGAGLVLLLVSVCLWCALGTSAPRARRLMALSVVVAVVGIYGGILVGGSFALRLSIPDRWQIAACDIGQGDAVLIRSQNRVALVDTGPDPALLTACLDRLGVDRLDLLVLTHYDLDHIGGVDAVEAITDLALVGPVASAADAATLSRLVEAGVDVRQVAEGDQGTLGALSFDVLWPPEKTSLRGNAASVTMRFDGEIDALFLGDLGEEDQNSLMAASRLDDVDVVKVAHHGSGDQSPLLYQRIGAAVGLVSVGIDNGYGHPNDRALGILSDSGTRALRTDQLGLILLELQNDGVHLWSERQAPAMVGAGG